MLVLTESVRNANMQKKNTKNTKTQNIIKTKHKQTLICFLKDRLNLCSSDLSMFCVCFYKTCVHKHKIRKSCDTSDALYVKRKNSVSCLCCDMLQAISKLPVRGFLSNKIFVQGNFKILFCYNSCVCCIVNVNHQRLLRDIDFISYVFLNVRIKSVC